MFFYGKNGFSVFTNKVLLLGGFQNKLLLPFNRKPVGQLKSVVTQVWKQLHFYDKGFYYLKKVI